MKLTSAIGLAVGAAAVLYGGMYWAVPKLFGPAPPAQHSIGVNDLFSVRGELLEDYVYDTGFGEMYRIVLETDKGVVEYPVLAERDELHALNMKYVSRDEVEGRRGDTLLVNPNSHIFSLDEVVLTPKHVKRM